MKNILSFILLILALGGCEQHQLQIGDESDGNAIALCVNIDQPNSTRAGAELLRTPSEVGSIGLYIYVVRPNGQVEVMGENLKLNYVEGQKLWEYDDATSAPEWGYTDGSDRYTFYAYAPYRSDGRGVNFDADNDEFSVAYNMSDNQDLMVARVSDIVCPAGGVVTLDLKHTLSAISLNTTYTSVITKVEFVASDDYYAAMPINGEVGVDDNGVVEWSSLSYADAANRYEMSSNSRSYLLLLPQKTSDKGDLFFSITSIKDKKVTVDENAKIPMMAFASNGIYKFNYKEPYFDLDDDGDLVIHVGEIMDDNNAWNDYTAIDELIEKLKENGHTTVKVVGEPKDATDAYHVIRHIIQTSGMEEYDLSEYIVPDGTKLPYDLFQKNKIVKNVVLPILDAGQMWANSFWGCSSLESVIFPEGQKLTALPYGVFQGCTSLTSVKLDMTSDTLTDINQSAFDGCSALADMKLPSSINNIGYGAFSNCSALSKINIPAAVTYINNQAFYNCTSLYSYGENKGILFDERTAQNTPIEVGQGGFVNTHVRYSDIPEGYVSSTTSDGRYFAEP